MASDKSTVVVYKDWITIFNNLTDEEAGKLIKHFFMYINDMDPEPEDRIIKLLFAPLELILKRDLNKWKNKCLKNKGNALMRWHNNNANACERIRMDAKHADSDNDSDNDSDSENISVNKNTNRPDFFSEDKPEIKTLEKTKTKIPATDNSGGATKDLVKESKEFYRKELKSLDIMERVNKQQYTKSGGPEYRLIVGYILGSGRLMELTELLKIKKQIYFKHMDRIFDAMERRKFLASTSYKNEDTVIMQALTRINNSNKVKTYKDLTKVLCNWVSSY